MEYEATHVDVVTMDESHAFEALRDKAERVASDIGGMEPLGDEETDGEGRYDTSYDLYVEELDGTLFGVIDMGDLYKEAFVWVDGEWDYAPVPETHMATTYPFTIVDRILKKRREGGGW